MKIKAPHIIYIAILLCTLMSSCEKVEIPQKEPNTPATENSGSTSSTQDALSVAEAIDLYKEVKTKISDQYITGYIVGYVNGRSIESTEFAAGEISTNIVIADIPVETDITKCIAVQLTTDTKECTKVRESLNLYTNPNMLKKKVLIKGDIDLYMSYVGIKKTREYKILEDDFDYEAWEKEQEEKNDTTNNDTITQPGKDDNDTINNDTIHSEATPSTPGEEIDKDKETEDNKSEDNTTEDNTSEDKKEDDEFLAIKEYVKNFGKTSAKAFTIDDLTEGKVKQYDDSLGINSTDRWVRGFIVGYVKGNHISTAVFATGNIASNVLLADSPDEQDYNKCIAIQLPTSSAACKTVRTAINLYEHPDNLGKQVIIKGKLDHYMGPLGLKEASDYKFP